VELNGTALNIPYPCVVQDAAVEEHTQGEVERVYREQAPRLWRSLVAYTGDRELANDAVAEAFAQVLARGEAVRDPERWVWRAAYRIAAGQLKVRRRNPPTPDTLDDARSSAIEKEVDLMTALARLPSRQRAALVLHYLADLPNPEIARALGITTSTVRVHLMQGRRRLRDLLGDPDA
jgi:RNA polymerase sigma-70 factor (ECF subfamily)